MEYGFGVTETARSILGKRYLKEGETKEDLVWRVANYIAGPDDDEGFHSDVSARKFADVITNGKFIPNSPCLVNAGVENGGGLFACFVIGMDDNLESISEAKTDAMAITKAGGGWGISISSLRPEGSKVSGSTHGIAGGPVKFLETFSYDMRTMTQGGFRDAACMATMDSAHPDILKFIDAKSPENSIIRLMNLDVLYGSDAKAVASKMLEDGVAVSASETYLSNFNISVIISNSLMERVLETDRAEGDLIGTIAKGMWENGEPGVLFIDTIRERTRYDPTLINATNPCGEQALPPNGSCCLGSINLAAHINVDGVDYDALEETARIAVRFLDNMVTQNQFPTEKTREWSHKNRAIGLGVMGLADLLVILGIRYGSPEALELSGSMASFLLAVAEDESTNLGSIKGDGIWDGRRNNALLSIAPTGTISLLAGCSPGIEPIYSDRIIRVDKTGRYEIDHPLRESPSFITTMELDPHDIINTVGAWAGYVDNSISYTVNLPNRATVEDVRDLIEYAWEIDCNGITVYRDGSRTRQVLSSEKEELLPAKRPKSLSGITIKYNGMVDGESTNLYVTLNRDGNGNLYEVFLRTPNIRNMTELQLITATTRLVSLLLRNGISIEDIIKQLERVEGQSLFSATAIIAKALIDVSSIGNKCNECGSAVVSTGGCDHCPACGWSSC